MKKSLQFDPIGREWNTKKIYELLNNEYNIFEYSTEKRGKPKYLVSQISTNQFHDLLSAAILRKTYCNSVCYLVHQENSGTLIFMILLASHAIS